MDCIRAQDILKNGKIYSLTADDEDQAWQHVRLCEVNDECKRINDLFPVGDDEP